MNRLIFWIVLVAAHSALSIYAYTVDKIGLFGCYTFMLGCSVVMLTLAIAEVHDE